MAWDHLSITKPHLVYLILGGFTSLFMLCSSVIKEKLYIGEATVATLCGIVFGPYAANLIDPINWGNSDLITLEFSRIVLVVQCFAVGVELPKSYMERHWKSVVFLLVPVMTWGWMITSLFVWWLFNSRIDWLDSLCIAACVTATDPVLASSVVGKGKFAKRIPKHLRDILSAESGCNDGMAFPFIYFAVYMIRYRPKADKVSYYWFLYTILYECLFGAIFGVIVGYLARRAIRYAHEKDLIDRESFLVFYFVLALFCAGSGSLLGLDDLLVGFACGVGFSNDGWFQEKTDESHVSNVIDLLINLAFFVYFGAIIPWNQFNSEIIGTSPWRLVVLALLVLFFRRIPIMMLLKPVIPDVKTWREALFAGHFGPIGVGGIFVAILARAELETESTTPLAVLPEPGFPHLNIIELIWPITVFLVITSIIVHGSSIAVFTLGKRINTLTLTVSFTQANEEGPSWMERLPRIQSRSKSQMSNRKPDEDSSMDEKMDYPPGTLPPVGYPGLLRRQTEEDTPKRMAGAKREVRKKKWDTGLGPGGPISESAIHPQSSRDNSDVISPIKREDSDLNGGSGADTSSSRTAKDTQQGEPEEEVYKEGEKTVFEDEEGNVLEVRDNKGQSEKERASDAEKEARKLVKEEDVEHGVAQKEHPTAQGHSKGWNQMRKRMESISGLMRREHEEPHQAPKAEPKRGAARAYQFGNTIIVEDEDGEVIKKYDIPPQRPTADRKASMFDAGKTKQRLQRMGTMLGVGREEASAAAEGSTVPGQSRNHPDLDDEHIRFTMTAGGRRMSKLEFIQQIQRLDPKARAALVEDSNAPEEVKEEARKEAREAEKEETGPLTKAHASDGGVHGAEVHRVGSHEDRPKGTENLTLVESDREVPFHSVSNDLAQYSLGSGSGKETAAERRRRLAALRQPETMPEEQSEDEGPTAPRRAPKTHMDEGETAAERKRREGALGISKEEEDSSSDEEDVTGTGMREPKPQRPRQQDEEEQARRTPGIRFAEQSRPTREPPPGPQAQGQGQGQSSSQSGGRLRWGDNVKK